MFAHSCVNKNIFMTLVTYKINGFSVYKRKFYGIFDFFFARKIVKKKKCLH